MGIADEQPIDVGSGPRTHDNNTRKKRMANVSAVKPKGKKKKVEVKEDKVKALYEKYITRGKPLRRSKPNELPTPFIKIVSTQARPINFQPDVLMAELERVVSKFKVPKWDLLWFSIVRERNWIVVCINLLHKQWNAFDSINAKGKPSPLKKQANNLITHFTTLTQECDAFNVNVASFSRADLEDYPKQNNLCNCGFFGVKYGRTLMEDTARVPHGKGIQPSPSPTQHSLNGTDIEGRVGRLISGWFKLNGIFH
ncbi:Cytokinin-O-glucosyltransferase 2 [Hordeum vulgare]|nr:Cytokinin-O-glucosyltransferase 2 [Hordeum vulgare]